jgi:hypothetical protein
MTPHPIPLAALDDRLGFVGTAGSGKTYNAGTGVERLLASGGRVIIPDPLGVWWGLGLCADGKSPAPWREKGKLVIFGGAHGDLPLNENAGALIGETVAGMAESAIIDLSGFGTKASEIRFMLAFLTALYRHASKEPVHLIFDEADMWAPQQEREKGEGPKLLGMMETVVRRGRIRGFIPWLISQRPAVLNKNVLSQVDGLVAFKLTASQDRKAIGDWVKGQADQGEWPMIDASLPTLPTGTGIVWLPSRGELATVAFPPKITFDSSRTPKRGEQVQRRELKPLDLDRLKSKLAAIEEEAKANDPRALQAEVARLKRELAKAEKVKAAPPQIVHANAEEIEKAREAGRSEGYAAGLRSAVEAISALSGGKMPAARPTRSAAPTAAFERVPAERMTVTATEGLNGPQQRVLNSLAWWAAFGIERPSNEQVAFIAGYSPIGGAYGNPRSSLKSMGLIDYPVPGKITLTEAGAEKADAPDSPTTRDELHRRVMSKLNGPQQRVLHPLLEAYPEAMPNDDLAAAAGYSPIGGAYGNPRSSLKSLSLIDYPERGQVRAADWLFP